MTTVVGPNSSDLIQFDEFSKIRILNPAQFDSSEKLKDETKDFISSMEN